MEFTYRPLTAWPGALTAKRQRAKFRAGYKDTLALLDRELRHLGARQVVLQVALTEDQIRLDGRPRAGASPSHPGIVLSFESKHGPLSYPCDRFTEWEDNLRAVALSLEALRAVDRYGVTRRAEQYRGWQALPPPAGRRLDVQSAVRLLARLSGLEVRADNLAEAYRAAALKAHPDRGGDAETFALLQEARDVLTHHLGAKP